LPTVILETVRVTREFLDAELKKYDNYELLNEFIRVLFESEHAYNQAKNKLEGIGRIPIMKFLGENWKQTINKAK